MSRIRSRAAVGGIGSTRPGLLRGIWLALAVTLAAPAVQAQTDILNSSYDVARELFAELNPLFSAHWQATEGQAVTVRQSHGGSSRQARAIIEGLQADVVTYNQYTDVDVLATRGRLIPADWAQRLPNNSSPFYSLPAFLVRAGNPKNIRDWDDLVREEVRVIFPNPKTSGNARYTYLAARAYAQRKFDGDVAQVEGFLRQLFRNVPVFDTGGRGATTTFVERGLGDVLITFESEVHGIRHEFGSDRYETVVPSLSLKAVFPVSVVDAVVDRRGTRKLAEGYLQWLYGPTAQEVLARRYHRVTDADIAARFADQFPDLELVDAETTFGDWERINREHFADGGLLDQVFVNR